MNHTSQRAYLALSISSECGLSLWLVLTNRINQKWLWASDSPESEEGLSTFTLLKAGCKKSGFPAGKPTGKDHMEGRRRNKEPDNSENGGFRSMIAAEPDLPVPGNLSHTNWSPIRWMKKPSWIFGLSRHHVELCSVWTPDPRGLYFPLMKVWEQYFAVS